MISPSKFRLFALPFLLAAIGCTQPMTDVLVTTTIIQDAAQRIAGDKLTVESLMGPGTDPHRYQPSAGDLGKLRSAKLVLFNGLHLEGKMADILEKAEEANSTNAVAVTKNLDHKTQLLSADIDGGSHDPHVWFDVMMWKNCVATIRDALIARFPEHTQTFTANAAIYLKELDDLERDIRKQIAELPESQRKLITGHDAFGYFARAYGFEVQGLQGVSTGAETGTGRIGELSEFIAKHKVRAIFTETSVPPRGLLQVQNSVKNDHKFTVNLVSEPDSLYSDALGAPGSPGATYAGMVRHNVDVIVRNLK